MIFWSWKGDIFGLCSCCHQVEERKWVEWWQRSPVAASLPVIGLTDGKWSPEMSCRTSSWSVPTIWACSQALAYYLYLASLNCLRPASLSHCCLAGRQGLNSLMNNDRPQHRAPAYRQTSITTTAATTLPSVHLGHLLQTAQSASWALCTSSGLMSERITRRIEILYMIN